jgi:hypothetical protein
MRRRHWLLLFPLSLPLLRAQGQDRLRGRLIQDDTRPPALRLPDGSETVLHGDRDTVGVLRDERLKNEDFEAAGTRRPDGSFDIDPIHLKAMFVHRGGRRLVVTYWCTICSIRTFTPGKCVCCQEETDFDPRDPNLKDTDPTHK